MDEATQTRVVDIMSKLDNIKEGAAKTKDGVMKAMESDLEKNPIDRAITQHLPAADNKVVQDVYQARWVWYHTILAIELFFTNLLLFLLLVVELIK